MNGQVESESISALKFLIVLPIITDKLNSTSCIWARNFQYCYRFFTNRENPILGSKNDESNKIAQFSTDGERPIL